MNRLPLFYLLVLLLSSCNFSQKREKQEEKDYFREYIPFEIKAAGDIDSIYIFESGKLNENNEGKIVKSTFYNFNEDGAVKSLIMNDSVTNTSILLNNKYKEKKKVYIEKDLLVGKSMVKYQMDLDSYKHNVEIWISKNFKIETGNNLYKQTENDTTYITYGQFMVETRRGAGGKSSEDFHQTCKYDSCGNEIEKEIRSSTPQIKVYTLVTSEYDKDDMLVKRYFITNIEGQPKSERYETYTYQKFDEHNNWTEQVVWDEDDIVQKAIQREIVYH